MSQIETRPPLTFAQAAAKRFGMLYSKVNYGVWNAPFTEEMVRGLGAKGFFSWAGTGGGAQTSLQKRYGPFATQLLTGVVAMLNGCTYCGKGHLYAANLHYFKDHNALFRIDEGDVYWLQRRHDDEVLVQFQDALSAPAMARDLALVERLIAIKTGRAEGETPDDPWLAAINGAWDWATDCSITLEIIDVPPLDSIGKDRSLMARYRATRDAHRVATADEPARAVDKPWQQTG